MREKIASIEPTIRDYNEYVLNQFGYKNAEKDWRPDLDKLHEVNLAWLNDWQSTFNKWLKEGYRYIVIDIFSGTFIPSKIRLDANHIGHGIELNGNNYQAIYILTKAYSDLRTAKIKAFGIIENFKN